MVDIQPAAAEIRRGKKKKKIERKKLQGKNIMAALLHRAAIKRFTKYQTNCTQAAERAKKNVIFLSLMTLTFDLQTHPSKGPNTSSV